MPTARQCSEVEGFRVAADIERAPQMAPSVASDDNVSRRNMGDRPRRPKSTPDQRLRVPPQRLEAMIEEAIVDAYTESEQAGGFHVMIEQELELPFETTVLGVTVSVKRVDITEANDVVAVCSRGRERQAIPILELPLPDPPPTGWEWIEAYRRWARGR
jgi:hypothetical protein